MRAHSKACRSLEARELLLHIERALLHLLDATAACPVARARAAAPAAAREHAGCFPAPPTVAGPEDA